MLIKDVLTIDLSIDIKNVIDLEDISEVEIQKEIENYIITDGLAKEFAGFVSDFTSNISETGVWISGFYGSGKSYFGKMLGYMLSNRIIAGTPARDRILQRFTGITDEAIIKNSISRLNTEDCRVVFLDIAKQDTSKGFAFTLFRNFLKSLELPENEHGFLLYQMMISDRLNNIHDFIFQNLNKNWADIKSRMIDYTKVIKSIYIQKGNSESEFESILTTIRRDIDQFGSSRLKDELSNYLKISKDEKVVFLFDEASEALEQAKYKLLDLEGISEDLSSLGGNVWTIAIAQQKLDDVINNLNVSRAQLTKVTDRFKTKIHLEATEVDVIIRSRLLKKNEDAVKNLVGYFNKNSGKVADHAGLFATGISKTESAESYVTYYPFYKYQFDLMQNFLFGTKGYASTKVAARGMIITTYDVLKRELQNSKIFDIATGWQIAKEAQPQPPPRLVNRYDNADRILREMQSPISGRHLLETINFLSEAEVVPTTLPNIIKSYIKDSDEFHKIQTDIVKAIEDLIEAKILLLTNNIYRITTDIEQHLLDEMNNFSVQSYLKKKEVFNIYKNSNIIKTINRITENNQQFDFYITTDNDDELTNPQLKYLKLKLKSLYNISDDRSADIDALKLQHQNDKDILWLVPDNSSFSEIDRLIEDIQKIGFLEDKYKNPQSEEGLILRSFSTAKSEKEIRVKDLIEQSLQDATTIYLYNTYQLNKDNWQTTLQAQQRDVIHNVFNKRLDSQISDDVAAIVIKEANNSRLKQFFHGKDFQFFDNEGNFIGEKLKVAEEILYKTRNSFVEGIVLEKDLEQPPTGFAFGTVMTTVAALMRAGKIMAKHNGEEKFSWRDSGVPGIFSAAREFRRASFKAIAKSISASRKNDLVTTLQELKCEEHLKDAKIDWNSNDYDLVKAVKELANRFCNKVDDMQKQNKDFDKLFQDIESQKDFLSSFTGEVRVDNYIDKAENFLTEKNTYMTAVRAIEKVEKYIGNNLPKVKLWKSFIESVNDELTKSAKTNNTISTITSEFNNLYNNDIVKNFAELQQYAQKIKDEYYNLMQIAATDMAGKYKQLNMDTESLIKEINSLPAGLNDATKTKVNAILQFASQRTKSTVEIDWEVKDKQTKFTYSEMLSFIELFNGKKADLDILKAELIKVEPPPPEPGKMPEAPAQRILTSKLPAKKLKVIIYKKWLHQELSKLVNANDDDYIEISNENE